MTYNFPFGGDKNIRKPAQILLEFFTSRAGVAGTLSYALLLYMLVSYGRELASTPYRTKPIAGSAVTVGLVYLCGAFIMATVFNPFNLSGCSQEILPRLFETSEVQPARDLGEEIFASTEPSPVNPAAQFEADQRLMKPHQEALGAALSNGEQRDRSHQ